MKFIIMSNYTITISDGFGMGAGNIIKGAVAGAALIVGAPVRGALEGSKENGVFGGVKVGTI